MGGLSKELIQNVVRRHKNGIGHCYEQALQRSPGLKGKLSVTFIIDSEGKVSEAIVAESTLGNEDMEKCILSRVERWRFPKPKAGGMVTVTYPWTFVPPGDPDLATLKEAESPTQPPTP